jgi:hypothetical protein
MGCSWALMATLFALGVMSPTWMAFIAAERLLDRRARLVVAIVLVALGAWVALSPGTVPALTVPGSQPMHAMTETSVAHGDRRDPATGSHATAHLGRAGRRRHEPNRPV